MKQLMTYWGGQLNQKHVLEEYPRPLMQRNSYVNLNGLWDYAFTPDKSKDLSAIGWEGKILVPFSPEAYLSGVNRQLKPGEYLWYRRDLPVPSDFEKGKRLLVHFGAVDQQCEIYVNQKSVMTHSGGYLPFEADVTEVLIPAGENELIVCVRDDSDTSYYSRGKQMLKSGGMFYTAQSGIWQTVWMECVPALHMRNIVCRPDADTGVVVFEAELAHAKETVCFCPDIYEAVIDPVNKLAAESLKHADPTERSEQDKSAQGEQQAEPVLLQTEELSSDIIMDGRKMILRHTIKIAASDRKLWTPDTPYLYYYSVRCGADEVAGYFALRTFSVEPDENGVARMCLNHRPYFQKGVLDQGYWPDGLYTAPSDSAMLYDIMKMKELGFSMLRKHLKIEPQRWYYHCDRLGMIVWQDMVNGGGRYRFWFVTYLATAFNMFKYRIRDNCHHLLARSDRRGREQFEQEMERTVRQLFGHPSIGTWVIFNEGWGQFDAVRMTEKMRALDSSRVIDSTSGWFDQGCGDLRSQHYYFFKLVLQWEKKRATVISELGGFPYRIEEHSFSDKVYGYHACNTQEELHAAYRHLMQDIIEPEIQKGLSATVYTQLSDVEEEVNGILTYDREVCKHADL